MQIRLRDHLGTAFNDMKKTPTNIFTNARSMAKLFKEAGRVKNVLSANADHYAQVFTTSQRPLDYFFNLLIYFYLTG